MRTKIAYVLVSSDHDIYYEQALLSAWSARHWNPEATIVLVMDNKTNARLCRNHCPLFDLVDEKVVVEYPDSMTGRLRSRELKTTLRQQISGDYLFIDADTIVCGSLSEVDSFQGQIGAVLDGHKLLDKSFHHHLVQASECLGIKIEDGASYYNSGVMVVRDTDDTHHFYNAWHELYEYLQKQGYFFDQPSLFAICQKYPIVEELDGSLNCQLFLGGLPFLGDAKIIHTFNDLGLAGYGNPVKGQKYNPTEPRLFYYPASTNFLMKVKQQGKLLDEDKQVALTAKRQFYGEYQLLFGKQIDYYHSSLFHVFCKQPFWFKLFDKAGRFLNRFL